MFQPLSQSRHKPRVGLLGLMLQLYDEALPHLKPIQEEFAQQLIQHWQNIFDICYSGIAVTRAEVEARLAVFRQEEADIIFVVHFSYAPSLIALPALRRCEIPLVLFNTQQLAGIGESFGYEEMLRNHGMHGQQDLANTLVRTGKPFGVVTGHWQDAEAMAELQDWAWAAAAAKKMRQAEIGRIGSPFQDMGDFGLDETQFMAHLGPHIQQISLAQLAERQEHAKAEDIHTIVQDYRAQYEMAGDVTEADLYASARIEAAMRALVGEQKLNGLAIHYQMLGEDPRFSALPFAAVARLLAEGIAFGGEGDVTSAAAVLLCHYLCGISTFSEMFTMDFAGERIFMSHFAEGNPALAAPGLPIQLVRREGWIGYGGPSLSLAFTMQPGPMTLVNLTVGAGGQLHLIAALGEAQDFLVPGQPTPHFCFQPQTPLKEFLSRYLELGGSHHVALTPGHQLSRLCKFAQMMELPLDVL